MATARAFQLGHELQPNGDARTMAARRAAHVNPGREACDLDHGACPIPSWRASPELVMPSCALPASRQTAACATPRPAEQCGCGANPPQPAGTIAQCAAATPRHAGQSQPETPGHGPAAPAPANALQGLCNASAYVANDIIHFPSQGKSSDSHVTIMPIEWALLDCALPAKPKIAHSIARRARYFPSRAYYRARR